MTGGATGAYAGVRGDVPGSMPEDGLIPPANSVQGAALRARLGRLRYALLDETNALARSHRLTGGDDAPHDGPGQCPVTDLDVQTLRRALVVLERVIKSK